MRTSKREEMKLAILNQIILNEELSKIDKTSRSGS